MWLIETDGDHSVYIYCSLVDSPALPPNRPTHVALSQILLGKSSRAIFRLVGSSWGHLEAVPTIVVASSQTRTLQHSLGNLCLHLLLLLLLLFLVLLRPPRHRHLLFHVTKAVKSLMKVFRVTIIFSWLSSVWLFLEYYLACPLVVFLWNSMPAAAP